MQDHGWHVRNSGEVAGTPELYRRYSNSRAVSSAARSLPA